MPDFDTSVPHIARVYDYWLGGKDNFAADRELGEQTLQAYPNLVFSVRANRAFLARAVRFLAGEAGIRQFLDIGTGIPTANNTHEVAQRIAPDSRIVYVDNDPVVLSHARALLKSSPRGRVRLPRRGPAGPGRDHCRGGGHAGLRPAGRGHADRGHALRRRRRRSQRDHRAG